MGVWGSRFVLATRMTDGKGRGRAAFPLVSSHDKLT